MKPEFLQTLLKRNHHPFLMWEGIQNCRKGLEDVLSPKVNEAVDAAADNLRLNAPIYFVGCGTSLYAGIAGEYAFREIADQLSFAREAFEFTEYLPPKVGESTIIAISHSGSTGAVLSAVERAKQAGANVVGITDDLDAPLADHVDHVIGSDLGLEPTLPKTRSYLSTLLRVFLLAADVGRRKGLDVQAFEEQFSQLPELVDQVLSVVEAPAETLAEVHASKARIIVVGNGPQLATAKEGALKLIESALVDSVAWELEEAGHGTWASTEAGDLAIVLAMEGPGLKKAQRLLTAMNSIDVDTWLITDTNLVFKHADDITRLPVQAAESILPVLAVLPLYTFTYFLALENDIHPDIMRLDDERYLTARTVLRSDDE